MNFKLAGNIDKIGTGGLFLTALFSPCCFPLFAVLASALGLGSVELLGEWTMWIFQALVLISLFGLYLSYRKHRCMYPLLVGIASGLIIFYGYHFNNSDHWIYFLYAGMSGLFVATFWNYRKNKLHGTCDTCIVVEGKKIELESEITCPNCLHKKKEMMPTDSCQFFYKCENCKTTLKPKKGDCCVYCSYGTVKCPSIQSGKDCC